MPTLTISDQNICRHDLEKMVLGSMISNSQDFDCAIPHLTPDCFDDAKLREIFEAMVAASEKGNHPDLLLTIDELNRRGSTIKAVEVMEYFVNTPALAFPEPHALKLRELAARRKLMQIGIMIAKNAANEAIDIVEIHSKASETLDSLFASAESDSVVMEDVYSKLQERMLINRDLGENETLGTPTGFDFIDKAGGLIPSELIVVGAESSKGKTSFATALTLKAVEHGHPVAFYSMEMQPIDITARIASMKTGFSVSKLLHNRMEIGEIYAVDAAMEKIRKNALFFDSRTMVNLDSMLSSIRRMKKKHDIRGAVVDYLQLIDISAAGCNREQATAECARKLKNLAMELNIWIIAISQLNRGEDGQVPSMSRLRGSGQIAEAANNIYLIHRTERSYPAPFENVSTEGTAMVIVAKGRNVGTGSFLCGFKAENTLFYPLSAPRLESLETTPATPSKPSSYNIESF